MVVKTSRLSRLCLAGRCDQRKCDKCEPLRGERYAFTDADINAGAFCFG